MDLSKVLKNTVGVGLEREAYRQFGLAVEEFTKGALGELIGRQPLPTDVTKAPQYSVKDAGIWEPTLYAAALARAGDFTPRLKFLFKVRFEFDPAIRDWLSNVSQKTIEDLERDLTFTVRTVEKPKFDFDYEEVNMYNFRTKILKRINQRELNITFFDDVRNNVFDFLNMYRMALQPSGRLSNASQIHNSLNEFGFSFSDEITTLDTSKRSTLPNNAINILQKITVYQIYINPNSEGGNPQFDVKSNKFVFVNPRITAIDLDDLDHEQGGTFNVASVHFDFDTLYMESNISLMNESDSGRFPEHPAGDILYSVGESQIRSGGKGVEISKTGKKNPFAEVLARQGQRAVQETISGILNKSLGTVAGGALGGAIYQVSGALGAAAGRTLAGVAAGVNHGIAVPSSPPVKDNSASGPQAAANSSQTYNDLKDFYG